MKPEKIMHHEIAAKDSSFGTFARLFIKPQADYRMGKSVREEIRARGPRPNRGKTVLDNRFCCA
jgi:hypothetical protein